VPLPWDGDRPPFGFTGGEAAWLPQPPEWVTLTVAVQLTDPASTLSLYRTALRLRRSLPDLHGSALSWCPTADDVLAFDRGPAFRCVVNFSAGPLDLTGQGRLLVASASCAGGLPPDAAAWLSSPGPA
jgi:alpha-glucosidase